MYELKDKVIVITGAAKGIGAAISREVLKEGAKHLRILDVDENAGIQLQHELNNKYGADKSKFVKCDVTKDEQLFSAFNDTKQEQGYLDVVFNNAGVANETSYTAIRKQIEINLTAVVNGTLKAIELMDENKSGRGGTVINMASVAGLFPVCPQLFTYSATKSAVLQFTSCIGKVQSEAIRVIALCFGATDTDIFNYTSSFEATGNKALAAMTVDHPKQSVESAARGTIEAYNKGKCGSIWLIQNNKSAEDITEDTKKCHKAMAKVVLRLSDITKAKM